jgi:hypothetical protein
LPSRIGTRRSAVTLSPGGDAVFATHVTFVSLPSTYTGNVSKKPRVFDTFNDSVDRIATIARYVDFWRKRRHE